MRSDDLTKGQCAAIRTRASDMVQYLVRIEDRMSYKGFPADDPVRIAVLNALAATKELYRETLARSIGVTEAPEPQQPPIDPFFTRRSKPRKHEKL